MSSFYKDFEDKFRGSRELITDRLRQYHPFLVALTKDGATPTALDLGCGRGEWLELLREYEFQAKGVDLDEEMLEPCRDLGLEVRNEEAVASLRETPESTLDLITAFHLVEHLPPAEAQTLALEAFRALGPGGLLILETPNPENLTVGATHFYLDPTHERPIPPSLLQFYIEFAGFYQFKILRLQEESDLHSSTEVSLLDVLTGVSFDYAVVAQKNGNPARTAAIASCFDKSYGHTLGELGTRYEARQRRAEEALEKFGRALEEEKHQREGLETRLSELSHAMSKLMEKDRKRSRPYWQRIAFHTNGRPRKLVKRFFFHSSGKPRRHLRRLVVKRDGRPRRLFRGWMQSPAYQALPRAVRAQSSSDGPPLQDNANPTPRGRFFLARVEAARSAMISRRKR